jgi:DNA topoisomerase-1
LPRTLGDGPDGATVVAQNGRYGPYVKHGAETRSLETEEQLLTISLDEALALLSQPKTRRGRSASTPRGPLREIGADPTSGKPLVIRDGRFGPYVTDGETNASLRRGDEVETVTIERAVELLAERRAAAPARRTRKRARG